MVKRNTAFFQDTELFEYVMNVNFVLVSLTLRQLVIITPQRLLNLSFAEQLGSLMTIINFK